MVCIKSQQHVFLMYNESKKQQVTKQQLTPVMATIALGSNMASRFGPVDVTVVQAMSRISAELGPITGKSRLYVTPCFPVGAGPDFINAVILVCTLLTADKVLEALHNIEADFGRKRAVRWGQRTLDLDLLCMETAVLPDHATQTTWRHLSPEEQVQRAPDRLILPHPRLQDRAFVLVPWAEIAPDWRHPILDQTVTEMLEHLPQSDIDAVVPLDVDHQQRPET